MSFLDKIDTVNKAMRGSLPKIIAFGDVHLGTYKMPVRDYIMGALWELVDMVAYEEPDVVLFAGDAFRHNIPSSKDISDFGKVIRSLTECCPVLMIPGNHDIAGDATTLNVFRGYEEVSVFTSPTVHKRNGVWYICIPWLPQKAVSSIGQSLVSDKRTNENIIDALLQSLLMQCDAGPRVLLAHATVLGSMMTQEAPAVLGRDILWPGGWLRHFDMCVFGHLHKPQEIHVGENTLAFYTGSICPVSFNETNQRKSVLRITDDEVCERQFSDENSPLFFQLEPFMMLHLDYEKIGERPVFVQVMHKTCNQDFDESELPPTTVWYEVIEVPERKEARTRVSEDDLGTSAIEALPLWLDMYEPDKKDAVLKLATQLLDDEPL